MNSEKLVLENLEGKVVRTFLALTGEAHFIQRKDTRRFEVHQDLKTLDSQNIAYQVLGKVPFSKLKSEDFLIPGIGKVRWQAAQDEVAKNQVTAAENDKEWRATVLVTGLLFAGMLSVFMNRPTMTDKLEQELKQQVVTLIKRIPINPQKLVQSQNRIEAAQNQKIVQTSGVKRLGALEVLGSSKSSSQKGGINLGAVNTTAGPGLGGTAGSGGMQTNVYSKGLVAAPLGPGANIKGAGGYGTKGRGGGQEGYGSMSLVGGTGAQPLPLANEATVGGGLDKDLIAAVIAKNLGQVRFCYEQGLQGNPGLGGRVAVDFTITGNGIVKVASIQNTTLNSKLVEDCILMRLKSWKFPLTEGGVDVKVSYPFVLRRLGQG